MKENPRLLMVFSIAFGYTVFDSFYPRISITQINSVARSGLCSGDSRTISSSAAKTKGIEDCCTHVKFKMLLNPFVFDIVKLSIPIMRARVIAQAINREAPWGTTRRKNSCRQRESRGHDDESTE